MLIQKANPVGIDKAIQQFQSAIHARLVTAWGLSDDSVYKSYPRCYRNKVADGYIAENFEGATGYKEVYWDDSLTALSFFGTSGDMRTEIGNTTSVHLVFFVNVSKLKPTIAHRADEEVRRDVQAAVSGGLFGHKLESVQLWLENVLREYPGSRRDDRLKAVDMHPVHCFRLNFSLSYKPNC